MSLKITVADYVRCPNKSVCAFMDFHTGHAIIMYSDNTFNTLVDNLKKLKAGTHVLNNLCNIDTLDFIILETLDAYRGSSVGKYRLKHWKEYVESMSKMTLIQCPKPLELTPKIIITGREGYMRGVKATLYLITKRYKKIKVADFKTIQDAEKAIADNDIITLLKAATKKSVAS